MSKQEILENEAREGSEETFDTSDPKAVNTAKKKAARTRADRLNFVNAAMQHEQGRAWFYDTMSFCNVFANAYSSDPYDTAFKCGMRNIGLRILADVQEAAPDEYITMVREAHPNKKKS